eukprot:NODE_6549_length_498_cov_0.744921.p5 GENE.NODE_6549_length_498_cov_0.744921~~NODE_6549_length_498_cov_0.744921.p5  ORF type:complete len:65 (+),score=4.87 NODE_6549_length_498_cov_0.744921:302-496(+)
MSETGHSEFLLHSCAAAIEASSCCQLLEGECLPSALLHGSSPRIHAWQGARSCASPPPAARVRQ